MRRLWIVVGFNLAVVCGLLVLTIAVDRRLASEISHREARYGECAARLQAQLMASHLPRVRPGTKAFRQLLSSDTHDTCGWSALSRRRPADIAGSVFFVVALGLLDLLLWRIWRDER